MGWSDMVLSSVGVVRRSGVRSVLIVAGLMLVFLALSLRSEAVQAANPPPNFAEVQIADQIFSPVSLAMAPDGRAFIMTDSGRAHVVKNDVLLNTPLFDIRSKVDDVGDRGLFSVAFDNNFEQNGFIYVVYTFDSNGTDDGIGRNRLVRFTVNGDTAGNETLLFDDFPEDPDVNLHYGGAVEHGDDGKLYVTIGDFLLGRNGQDRSNLKGTILRLNTDGSIPSDNPFFGELQGVNRAIFAYGVRNPWQTVENPRTGEIFFSDVGSSDYEELNVLEAGGNYGWFEAEGPKDPNDPSQASFIDPLFAYRHVDNFPNDPFAGCAIVGGSFYETDNPTFPPEYRGQYFTGDFCEGRIFTVDPDTGQARNFMDGFNFGLVDMAVSPTNGDLYFIDQTFNDDDTFPRGGIGKITFVGPQTDITITSQPADLSISAGGDASFFVAVTAPGNTTYQWLRNGSPINGETESRLTISNVDAGDDGDRFSVIVSSAGQTVTSDEAVLTLSSNRAPVPNISFSGADGGYEAGEPISFSGSATDAEDGAIPESSLRWDIRLNHDDHDHGLVSGLVTDSGTYAVPTAIETDTNVWLTLYLTATDSDGTSTTVTQRIDPKIVTITLASDPANLDVTLDGNSRSAPFSFDSVVGVDREVSAPASQTQNGTTFTFASWSDGRGRDAVRATPDNDTTWTARYNGGGDPAPGECTVVASGGGILLTWSDGPGTEIIRNDDGWVTTPTAGVLSYSGSGSVDDGWFIRRTRGGDETCSTGGGDPDPDPDPTPGDCRVVASGDGILLTWSNQPGNEIIRNDDGWVTTPAAGVLSYSGDGSVDDGWLIRRRGVDEVCTGGGGNPNPVPDNICSVDRLGDGVRITWQNGPGTEVLRNADGWVATPPSGTLTFDDPDGSLNDGWLIRRTRVAPDETCVVLGD